MINLINEQNLEIYTAFIDEFGETLRNINPDSETNILVVDVSYYLAPAVTISHDPFATNTIMNPLLIVMNECVCNKLRLTRRECFAMIAHEVGHILDSTPRLGNEMLREENADMFAVKLGLTEFLISGFTKIIDNVSYAGEVEGIQGRIHLLQNR